MHVLVHVWGHGVGGVLGSILGAVAGTWMSTPTNCVAGFFEYQCHRDGFGLAFYTAPVPESAWLIPAVLCGVVGIGVAHAVKTAQERAH